MKEQPAKSRPTRRGPAPSSTFSGPLLWVGAGVFALLAVIFIGQIRSKQEREKQSEIRTQALSKLSIAAERAGALARERSLREAEKEIRKVEEGYPSLVSDPVFSKKLRQAYLAVEEARKKAFAEDWTALKEAYRKKDFAGARAIAEGIRRYGTVAQLRTADDALSKIKEAERRLSALAALASAEKEAVLLCAERRFGEARAVLRKVLRAYSDVSTYAVFEKAFQKALAEIERLRDRQCRRDLALLSEAAEGGRLTECRSILKAFSAYATEKEIREAQGILREAEKNAVSAAQKPARGERAEKTARSQAPPNEPAVVAKEKEAGASPQKAKKAARRKERLRLEDLPPVSRAEMAEVVRSFERLWYKTMTTPAGNRVTGRIGVLVDSLRYQMALKALDALQRGAGSLRALRATESFLKGRGGEFRRKPMVTIELTCSSDYGLFFPKGDLRRCFIVKYNDSTVSRKILEKSRTPRWESWTLYIRDRHRIPRYQVVVWLFQGSMRLRLLLASPWKKQRLSVQLAGVWGLHKFRPGDSDWPGWNPERRTIQRYKRISIDFASQPVTFYPEERSGKDVALPPALEALYRAWQ